MRFFACMRCSEIKLDSLLNENTKPAAIFALLKGFTSKQIIAISDQSKATFCFTSGFNHAALAYSVEGINKSMVNMPNIFINLSLYFYEKGSYKKAENSNEKAE